MEGLAEGRPSVLVGDFILVKRHEGSDTWYKGCVHEVMADSVSLRFDEAFTAIKGSKFDVQFLLNRLPFRRMHQALTARSDTRRLVFPEHQHVKASPVTVEEIASIKPFNRRIGENPEQLTAVASIVNQPPGCVPFLIFGPSVLHCLLTLCC